MTDEWIAYRGAVALIRDEDAALRALMTGAVKSRGVIYSPLPGSAELEDIPANLWAQWAFLPTFRGLSDKRRALVWLVPQGEQLSPICRGYDDIVLSRADVERLSSPSAIAPNPAKVMAPKKGGLPAAVARALEKRFPEGRPAGRGRNELAVLMSEEMKLRTVPSLKTIDRALALAWADAGPK